MQMVQTPKCRFPWPFGESLTTVHCRCGQHQRLGLGRVYTFACTDTQTDCWVIYTSIHKGGLGV